jgi:release factor glutamine methyltransferase
MKTIRELLQWAATLNSDSPALDTQLLLCHALDCRRAYLYAWPEKSVTPEQLACFEELMAERRRGVPIAHLIGVQEFWSLPFRVSPATLIPRPATETLVQRALELPLRIDARILDLGTGTGAIALALARERPGWLIEAVDSQPDAVGLALDNARQLACSNVRVRLGNWFEGLSGCFDLIVSNPPYIDDSDGHLEEGDVRFEPRSALVATGGGLDDIRHIICRGKSYVLPGGFLLVEHGYRQGREVRRMMQDCGYGGVLTTCDLGGQERVTEGFAPQQVP